MVKWVDKGRRLIKQINLIWKRIHYHNQIRYVGRTACREGTETEIEFGFEKKFDKEKDLVSQSKFFSKRDGIRCTNQI